MKRFLFSTIIAAAIFLLGACDKVDNKSIPSYTVRINLSDYASWVTYGVNGVGEYRVFNRDKKLPANYAYDVNTYTGYGGVLLMMGIDMVPLAYDMACPIEARRDVAVTIDSSNFEAECPTCKSRFNVLTGAGGPISGMALTHKKGLTIYQVHKAAAGGYLISTY